MLRPGSLRWLTAQSMAAMTWETSVAPSAVATFRLTSVASGAMPAKLTLLSPVVWVGSCPAMMPAICVPWPNVSRFRNAGVCDSNDRSGPLTTLPVPARPLTGAIPESINATPIPLPVTFLLLASSLPQTASAPVVTTTDDSRAS
jgi:hypothetical protein